MPTAAYTNLDSANPLGSQTPTAFAASTLANILALRDEVITGRVAGFIQSRTTGTGTANQPQYISFTNGTMVFRATYTWTGYQPTTVLWEWSTDTGATWATLGAAQVNTFDAANNITASTNSGGIGTYLHELWAKVLKLVADVATDVAALATHAALTGASAHGNGTMSTQSAGAVVITGGTADLARARETFTNLGSIAAAGTATLNMATASHYACTPSATTSDTMTIAVSNPPAAGLTQTLILEIINGRRSADAKISWPASFKWIGGSTARPTDTTLELSGRNLFSITTRDGGTRYEIVHLGAGG